MSIFKACDIRGRYPDEIDEDISYKIGRAIGTISKSKAVLVCGDVRLSTPRIKNALIRGLLNSGANVLDAGIAPTPAFYHAKSRLGCEAAVMITASHNPPDYNGFKLSLGKLPITEEEIENIRKLVESGEFSSGAGSLKNIEIIYDYKNYILGAGRKLLGNAAHLPKVVIDCGNGCFSEIAPGVLDELGIFCIPLYCEADGAFPNRSPNSAIPSNLASLCDAVVSSKADLGIAFDGDGDRVSFVDETGTVLTADSSIAIIAKYKNNCVKAGDKVVLDIKCSSAVSDVIKLLGGEPLIEKSGHTFIKTRMLKENAVFGGEISGHFFYKELNGGDDGLYSALQMIDIVGRQGKLSSLRKEIPKYVTTPDLRLKVNPDPAILDKIASAFPDERVLRLDGVRVQFEDGWGLARISVTEPVITLRFEARDKEGLEQIMNQFLAPVPLLRDAAFKSLGQ